MKWIGIIIVGLLLCSFSVTAQTEIKIGSHNSLSYLKPQWWLRWMNFTAKCQNLTVEEQYELGVRYFDFRFKFTRKGRIRSGHGPMTYKADFDGLFSFLDTKGDCLVNVMLENRSRQDTRMDADFVNYVDWLVKKYPHIRFVGGYKKRPFEKLIALEEVPTKSCFEWYEGENLKLPYPRKYAKRNNRKYWKEVDSEAYNIFDFVELYFPFDTVSKKR